MEYQYVGVTIIVIGVFYFGYKVGWHLANFTDHKNSTHKDLHCFECEIEMPVKEKKGRLYCANCGLSHGKL